MSVFVGERDVVEISGPEAATYLQGQVSQEVLSLPVGESAWSFILQPQGKVDSWFRLTRSADDRFLLDVDAGHGEALLARIKRFLLRTKVELDLQTWTLHAYDAPMESTPDAPIVAPASDGLGVDVIGPDLGEPEGELVSFDAHEKRRILAGVPAMGPELDENTIPAESRMVDRSVDFDKGCYTGQELVARVDSRGDNAPRRLRIITGEGAASVGDALSFEGGDVGQLTSVAPDGEGFVALGYVKRAALEHGSLQLGDRVVDVRPVPADRGSGES